MTPTIRTHAGLTVRPFQLDPALVHIEDIAHALSHICRWTGHVREFYSVAQHSVEVSLACHPQDALWGLLHDASEAYLGDVASPIKRAAAMRIYRNVERRAMDVICARFRLPSGQPRSVKAADKMLLAAEARDLMGIKPGDGGISWRVIQPLPPSAARQLFLDRFQALSGGGR